MLEILYHGTKLEANALNSILNHSAEEKTTRNSVPKHVSDENMLSILFAGAGFFLNNFFHALSFRSELRNRLFRKLRNASEK
jgi:hypothetical protein